jgi:hypothetical protein
MQILRTTQELTAYLKGMNREAGCFADTSFLYGVSDDEDRLFGKAVDIHDLLSESSISIHANVISRLEFVDLILRKQLTGGCVKLFGQIERSFDGSELYNLLKNIRDNDAKAQKNGESYKINESQIKRLKKLIIETTTGTNWKSFCAKYTGSVLLSEWKVLEDELGLNFIEILEGERSEFFTEPLRWDDMVQIMGKHGMRGPDAMIANFFLKSRFPLLITGDSDFENCFEDADTSTKAIYIL